MTGGRCCYGFDVGGNAPAVDDVEDVERLRHGRHRLRRPRLRHVRLQHPPLPFQHPLPSRRREKHFLRLSRSCSETYIFGPRTLPLYIIGSTVCMINQ